MYGFEFGDWEYSVINSNGFALIGLNSDGGGFGEILIGQNGSIFVLSSQKKSNGVIRHFLFQGFGRLVIKAELQAKGVHIFLHGLKVKIFIVMKVNFLCQFFSCGDWVCFKFTKFPDKVVGTAAVNLFGQVERGRRWRHGITLSVVETGAVLFLGLLCRLRFYQGLCFGVFFDDFTVWYR